MGVSVKYMSLTALKWKSVFTNSIQTQNLPFLFTCSHQRGYAALYSSVYLWHLPKERPELLVITVARATRWVIFCNFPREISVDGGVHVVMQYTTKKHLQRQN